MALDAARRIFRRMQLFCPSRQPEKSWNPEDYGIPPGVTEELWIETDDGEFLYAWYCRAENPIASALYFHGNTGNLTTTAFTIPHMLRAGISVLYVDYRGFGRSTGSPSFNGIIEDGVAAARSARNCWSSTAACTRTCGSAIPTRWCARSAVSPDRCPSARTRSRRRRVSSIT